MTRGMRIILAKLLTNLRPIYRMRNQVLVKVLEVIMLRRVWILAQARLVRGPGRNGGNKKEEIIRII